LLVRFLASLRTSPPDRPSATARGFFRFLLSHHSGLFSYLHRPDAPLTDLIGEITG